MKDALDASVFVIDVDKKDRYQEIYIQFEKTDLCFVKGICYRYSDGRLKKYFTFSEKDCCAYLRLHLIEKQKGDGQVYFASEYYDPYLGRGEVTQAYQIVSGMLKPVSKKILQTTDEWKKKQYKAMKSLKGSDPSLDFTLPRSNVFFIEKIKFRSSDDLGDGVHSIYIRTVDGKKGWVKNPQENVFLGWFEWYGWTETPYIWGLEESLD